MARHRRYLIMVTLDNFVVSMSGGEDSRRNIKNKYGINHLHICHIMTCIECGRTISIYRGRPSGRSNGQDLAELECIALGHHHKLITWDDLEQQKLDETIITYDIKDWIGDSEEKMQECAKSDIREFTCNDCIWYGKEEINLKPITFDECLTRGGFNKCPMYIIEQV